MRSLPKTLLAGLLALVVIDLALWLAILWLFIKLLHALSGAICVMGGEDLTKCLPR